MSWMWPIQLVIWWLQYGHMPIDASPDQERRWQSNALLVPTALMPPGQTEAEFYAGPHAEARTPELGCTMAGNRAPYWLPRRELLWLFLRWPLECEAMHWLQTCDLDRCDGVRTEYIEDGDPSPWLGILIFIRCDEFGNAFGPFHAVEYDCRNGRFGWSLCIRRPTSYSRHLHPCHRKHVEEDVPCATEEMKTVRKNWRQGGRCYRGYQF